jgi:5-methyltetrahydropteroyltriglutamate--homocysteine methyltransferase
MFTIAVNGSYPRLLEPPRPQLLMKAIEDHKSGRITDRELERAKERATIDAVAEMVAAGVEIISDGQIRWEDVNLHIYRCLDGFATREDGVESDNGNLKPRATATIRWNRPILLDVYKFLLNRSPVEVRPVLTGPYTLARICDSGIYGDDLDALTIDLARALNRELVGFENAGFKYILIEEPILLKHKEDIGGFVKAMSVLLDSLTATIMLGISGGDILDIEDKLSETAFGGFTLDMLEGPGSVKAITGSSVWSEKILQAGLVDSYSTEVERPTRIFQALMELAQHFNPENIWVAPTAGLGWLPRDIAFAKLKSLYEGACRARREVARLEEPGGSLPAN